MLLTSVCFTVAIVREKFFQSEPGQMQILHHLHGIALLPKKHQIGRCPSIYENGRRRLFNRERPQIAKFNRAKLNIDASHRYYLQLAIRSEQTCRSKGYSFKFMGQESVRDILCESSESLRKADTRRFAITICINEAVDNRALSRASRHDFSFRSDKPAPRLSAVQSKREKKRVSSNLS